MYGKQFVNLDLLYYVVAEIYYGQGAERNLNTNNCQSFTIVGHGYSLSPLWEKFDLYFRNCINPDITINIQYIMIKNTCANVVLR